jgi:UDP-N-acetylmuramoyl-tripeptide--D-alanyl-D-alanine ligase
MKNAIAYLVDMSERSKRVAVVGDMLELGGYSKRLHRELGKDLAKAGVKKVIAIGAFASDVAICCCEGRYLCQKGFYSRRFGASCTDSKKRDLEGDMVLLKGSRGVHLRLSLRSFRCRKTLQVLLNKNV